MEGKSYLRMKLNIVTIVLDGQPYIERHISVFQSLTIPWTWHIREGAAANTHCTRWCKIQRLRVSNDGTHEYLESIKDPRVKFYSQTWWDGKIAMFNDVADHIDEPCVLMEIDSDELWTVDQIKLIVELFELNPDVNLMRFYCNYFVGPDIITMGQDCYGNNPGEWLRAWRFKPGMRFDSHEPPVLGGNIGKCLSREITQAWGLVFNHYAYATKAQVAYKEKFYGYKNATVHWQRLQQNQNWPVKLRNFLPWVDDHVMATRIKEIEQKGF